MTTNREPSLLSRLNDGARVLVIRLRSLGDCVLTTPAIYLLRQARPDLRIGVVVEDRFAEIYHESPDIDEVLAPELRAVRGFRAEVAINLHGGTRSMWLTKLSGAPYRVGYGHYLQPWIYTDLVPRAQEILGEERVVHTAEHVASAMFHLGVGRREIPRARLFATREAAGSAYAVMHPFASSMDKQWAAERFVEVGRWLQRERGLRVMVSATATEDVGPFAEFECRTNQGVAGLKRLIAGASMFVGNDSGPAHVAAAFGVPLVALFGPSEFAVWRPWRANGEGIAAPGGDLRRLEVETVIAAMAKLEVVR